MSKSKKELELVFIGLGAMLFFTVIIFISVWLTRPEIISKIYAVIRQIQTFGQWDMIPTGEQFLAEESGKQSIWLLFRSSVPFGIFSAIGIATMAFIAYTKVSDEHLDKFITHKNPPDHIAILEKFTHTTPAARFILDYNGYPLSSTKGTGRLPYNPLDYLFKNNLVRRIGHEEEWHDESRGGDFIAPNPYKFLDIDEDKLRDLMADTFGPHNPFLKLNSLTNVADIKGAIDKLPWYVVVVLAPALARIQRSIYFNEEAYVDSVMDLHKFPNKVWDDLNQLKAKAGIRLRLGFDDDKHRASEESLYQEGGGKRSKKASAKHISGLITLAEHTSEEIVFGKDKRKVSRGDGMPSVIAARKLLLEVLTTHLCEERKAFPVGEDPKTKSYTTIATPPATAVEKTYFSKVQEQMVEASETMLTLLHRNGYVFGLLGAAVERTRDMGIYHPTPWRWMRFINLPLWRFFLDLGKPMPTVDSMGMWEHYKSEGQLNMPILEPFLRRAPNDLARQAAKFVTTDVETFFNKNMSMATAAPDIAARVFGSEGQAEPSGDQLEVLDALAGMSDEKPTAVADDIIDAELVDEEKVVSGPVKLKTTRRKRTVSTAQKSEDNKPSIS